MPKFKGAQAITVTVRRSFPAAIAAGATALVLDTVEQGPIAFVVNLEVIALIRKDLAALETMLTRPTGRA